LLHHVGDLFELNVKLRCQKVNQHGLPWYWTLASVMGIWWPWLSSAQYRNGMASVHQALNPKHWSYIFFWIS